MQNCIPKFSEDELILISDFLKTLFQKKEFSLVRRLLLLADSYANTVSLEEKESQSMKSLSIINKISFDIMCV